MNVYSSLEDMPELKEGQIECLELNEEQISVTFKICKGSRCDSCAFDNMPADFCRDAKCSISNRSDRKGGVYVVVNREKMGLQITEANWDFVEENITELGRQYNERQAILRACIDEGKILDRDRLMEYYRSLAMVYIDAVNNFTKHIDMHDTEADQIPELKEGQTYKIVFDGKEKCITFKRSKGACTGCIFKERDYAACVGAKCAYPERSDDAIGIFMEAPGD